MSDDKVTYLIGLLILLVLMAVANASGPAEPGTTDPEPCGGQVTYTCVP